MRGHVQAQKACRHCGDFRRYADKQGRGRRCVGCAKAKYVGDTRTPEQRLRQAFRLAQKRAAENDLPFTLVYEDLVIPDRCPVLGIAMDTPSLDQHQPGQGYTPENVRVISWRANRLKNDGTLDEFEKLVTYLRNTR